MRTNPFAPDVPCHRVLAGKGELGGYKGSWARVKDKKGKARAKGDGDDDDKGQGVPRPSAEQVEKLERLLMEGVRFDDDRKVKGEIFTDFSWTAE